MPRLNEERDGNYAEYSGTGTGSFWDRLCESVAGDHTAGTERLGCNEQAGTGTGTDAGREETWTPSSAIEAFLPEEGWQHIAGTGTCPCCVSCPCVCVELCTCKRLRVVISDRTGGCVGCFPDEFFLDHSGIGPSLNTQFGDNGYPGTEWPCSQDGIDNPDGPVCSWQFNCKTAGNPYTLTNTCMGMSNGGEFTSYILHQCQNLGTGSQGPFELIIDVTVLGVPPLARIGACGATGGTFRATITCVDAGTAPDPDLPWFCIKTGTPGNRRQCVQSPTTAYDGPFPSQSACESGCPEPDTWCVEWQDEDADGNPTGKPYVTCEGLGTGDELGQIISEANRTGIVINGPWSSANCSLACPPCSGDYAS